MILMRPIDVKAFILSFIHGRNPEEAAIAAGVSPVRAKLEGLRLLADKRVARQLAKEETAGAERTSDIRAGLERLAYGRINDAAAIAFSEEVTPHMMAHADLFNVSEIKRVKGGGVEIKFFDRLKALEKLDELSQRVNSDRKAADMLTALYGDDGGESISSDRPLESEAE